MLKHSFNFFTNTNEVLLQHIHHIIIFSSSVFRSQGDQFSITIYFFILILFKVTELCFIFIKIFF